MKNKILFALIILLVASLLGGCWKSQYEKDLESGKNKNWDDMTKGEKEAVGDYYEWYVEYYWE